MHPTPPTASGSTDPRVYLDRLSETGATRTTKETNGNGKLLRNVTDRRWILVRRKTTSLLTLRRSLSTSASASNQPSGHWVKVLDDDLIRAQQAAYSVQGVDESQPSQAVLRRGRNVPPLRPPLLRYRKPISYRHRNDPNLSLHSTLRICRSTLQPKK